MSIEETREARVSIVEGLEKTASDAKGFPTMIVYYESLILAIEILREAGYLDPTGESEFDVLMKARRDCE